MSNRKYKMLYIVQSACVTAFLLHYYLWSTVQDAAHKQISKAKSLMREVQEDGPQYDAEIADRISMNLDNKDLVVTNIPTKGLSGCTLADIDRRPGVMLVTTTNTAFLSITLNMVESIRRSGVCVNTSIFAEDEKAYKYLYNAAMDDPAVHILKTDLGFSSTEMLSWNSTRYLHLVAKRHMYLLNFLRQGLEVLFCDADNFWFQDPFPYLQGDFDIAMFDEMLFYPTRGQNQSVFCNGFAYYKPTERTIKVVTSWTQALHEDPTAMDQFVLNDMLRVDKPVHVDIRSLKPSLFPGGWLYYLKPGWRKLHPNPVVMHSTAIFGSINKIKRYKKDKMWLVDRKVLESLPKP